MEIKLRYDTANQWFDLEKTDIEKWLSIHRLPEETSESFQKRAQQLIDIEYNRPEYNNWHKYHRHSIYRVSGDNKDSLDTDALFINQVKDKRIFYSNELAYQQDAIYKNLCAFIRNYFSKNPELAEMFIAIRLNGVRINDYAKYLLRKNESADNVEDTTTVTKMANRITQKLERASEKLKQALDTFDNLIV